MDRSTENRYVFRVLSVFAVEHGWCIMDMTEMTDRRMQSAAWRIYSERENACGAIARVR
jgi:hypothetical protein